MTWCLRSRTAGQATWPSPRCCRPVHSRRHILVRWLPQNLPAQFNFEKVVKCERKQCWIYVKQDMKRRCGGCRVSKARRVTHHHHKFRRVGFQSPASTPTRTHPRPLPNHFRRSEVNQRLIHLAPRNKRPRSDTKHISETQCQPVQDQAVRSELASELRDLASCRLTDELRPFSKRMRPLSRYPLEGRKSVQPKLGPK